MLDPSGPGWGNGKATSVAFAREGAQILCADRDAEAAQETCDLITGEGGVAQILVVDVAARDAGNEVVSAMEQNFGGIDVLHYNVGISSRGGTVETTDEDWARVFDINLTGAMRLTRTALPAMRAQGSGACTYVSSVAAVYSGPYSYIPYETSKAALCRFSRSIAKVQPRISHMLRCFYPQMKLHLLLGSIYGSMEGCAAKMLEKRSREQSNLPTSLNEDRQ